MKKSVSQSVFVPFGISGFIILSTLAGGRSQGIVRPQAGGWKTIMGEPQNPAPIDAFLRKTLGESRASALSVAVVRGADIVFHRTMGYVDKKSQRPVDERTVFRTASLSKPVFAYLAMKLVDEGYLELDRAVHQYLKRPLHEYAAYTDLKGDERYKLLTIRLLLSHQGGFPNWRFVNPDRRLDFKFTPGAMFKYSGEGYRLMQFILEELTGRDLNSLAGDKVFRPLGMADTSFLWEKRFNGNFAVNLETELRPLIERTRTSANAAASLLTNSADYAKFLLAVMNGTGLKPATLKMMLEPQVGITSRSLHAPQGTDPRIQETLHLAWAMGWGRFRCPQGEAAFHIGFEEGCDNYVVVFLDRKMGLVLQSVIPDVEGIAPAVAKELIGDVYSPFSWLQYQLP